VATHGLGLTEADREALRALQIETKEAEDAKRATLIPQRRRLSSQSSV